MRSVAMLSNGTEKGVNNMKPHYSEFVRHCIRYYVLTLDEGKGGLPHFRTDAERDNWKACYQVLKDYSTRDMDTISQLYRPGDTLPDKIYAIAKAGQISQNSLWNLVSDTEKKIAKERGLI